MKKLLISILIFICSILYADNSVGAFHLEQYFNELQQPKGNVKRTLIYMSSLGKLSGNEIVVHEAGYSRSGLLDYVTFVRTDYGRFSESMTVNYSYDMGCLRHLACYSGNIEIATASFLDVTSEKYVFAQTIHDGFSDIKDIIDIGGFLHFEVFKPESLIGEKCISLAVKSKNQWSREIYSPKQKEQSRKNLYEVIISEINNREWKLHFHDKSMGIEFIIKLSYGPYGLSSIELSQPGKQAWIETYNYGDFDTEGNWTSLVVQNSISAMLYRREMEYY